MRQLWSQISNKTGNFTSFAYDVQVCFSGYFLSLPTVNICVKTVKGMQTVGARLQFIACIHFS